jgi:hypothetical protein
MSANPHPRLANGWFLKQNRSGGIFKTWKERWIVLDQGTLRYYTTKALQPPYGEDLRGEYNLKNASLVIDKSNRGTGKIMVKSPKEGTFLLDAGQNFKLKASWMKAIDEHIDYANGVYINNQNESSNKVKEFKDKEVDASCLLSNDYDAKPVVLKNSLVGGLRVASVRITSNAIQYMPADSSFEDVRKGRKPGADWLTMAEETLEDFDDAPGGNASCNSTGTQQETPYASLEESGDNDIMSSERGPSESPKSQVALVKTLDAWTPVKPVVPEEEQMTKNPETVEAVPFQKPIEHTSTLTLARAAHPFKRPS